MVQRQRDDMEKHLKRYLNELLRVPLDREKNLFYLIEEVLNYYNTF